MRSWISLNIQIPVKYVFSIIYVYGKNGYMYLINIGLIYMISIQYFVNRKQKKVTVVFMEKYIFTRLLKVFLYLLQTHLAQFLADLLDCDLVCVNAFNDLVITVTVSVPQHLQLH